MKRYGLPLALLLVFETVAVALWLALDNVFYLFNFSYIGLSVSLGIFLYIRQYRHARRIAQLLVGTYMLVYLGLICGENMQIEGFWAGAAMPAGRRWFWIFCLIKRRAGRGSGWGGSAASPSRPR